LFCSLVGVTSHSAIIPADHFSQTVLADQFGRKRMMVIGLAAQSVLSVLYLVITDPVTFVILRFFEGMVAASVIPSARALVAETIAPEQQGEAYGIFGAFLNAGFLFGPALGGLFASTGYASGSSAHASYELQPWWWCWRWCRWTHGAIRRHGRGPERCHVARS